MSKDPLAEVARAEITVLDCLAELQTAIAFHLRNALAEIESFTMEIEKSS